MPELHSGGSNAYHRMTDRNQFWSNIIRAVEAEPQNANSISGRSGLDHPVVATGLDESADD